MYTHEHALKKLYTFEHEHGGTFSVKAVSLKDCEKKLKRYLDDMYETKHRELKRITYVNDWWFFEFHGRIIKLKFIAFETL